MREQWAAAWSLTRRVAMAGMLAVTITAFAPAQAQDVYPSKMIRLLVPFPAGSATDVEARFLAEKVGAVLGQKILVDNKPGANANIGAAEVARAPGDGYTLYLATNSTHSANVHLYNKMPFDPVADFTPIARLTRNPLVMVVAKDFPAKDLKEFIAYAKANPGKLSYGSGNTGSMAAAQLVRSMASIDAVRISYPGTPQAITDLLGGRIEFIITDVAVTREFINNGSLRALGVTTPQKVASLPDVAPMAAVGLPGYDFAAWSGLFAPKNVPADIVQKLNKAFLQVMATDEAKSFSPISVSSRMSARRKASPSTSPSRPSCGGASSRSPVLKKSDLVGELFSQLPALLESDTALIQRGRFLDVDCLLGSTEQAFHVAIRAGRIIDMVPAPVLMRSWTFGYRATPDAWTAFWQPMPKAGWHDLLSLTKRDEATSKVTSSPS
jgi:tripartite-type tricarboxylate transporter receptor subunit TctC